MFGGQAAVSAATGRGAETRANGTTSRLECAEGDPAPKSLRCTVAPAEGSRAPTTAAGSRMLTCRVSAPDSENVSHAYITHCTHTPTQSQGTTPANGHEVQMDNFAHLKREQSLRRLKRGYKQLERATPVLS